ncbi:MULTISPECIES: alpha/beta-hydrolase family protein [unclassified Thioalkalivibrio]|uniref:alpha/beta hydrolase n=1 Tax=unclassified Thioalkalivibrio TaxID=2621013 RepID=UPI000374962B|nr:MULTISPECIES: alpha/beta-hydrolase family protein [unclassified Thioalkalivibrio]
MSFPDSVARLAARIPLPRWLAPGWARRLAASLSVPGLLLGTLFFAASLSPSLIPRTWEMQGILSGISLSAGYLLGVFLHWLWAYLELPEAGERVHRIMVSVAAVLCAIIAVAFLMQAAQWQNSIRELMELDPVDSAHPFRTGMIGLAVFAAALAVGRLFLLSFRFVAVRLRRFIPRRLANVTGVIVALSLFWAVIDGVLLEYGLRTADRTFQQFDVRMEADVEHPGDPLLSGSEASLIGWEDLGQHGRRYVGFTPTSGEMSEFFDRPTPAPLRVYVGLNAAETIEERARLALDELKRTDAFDRSVLVLVTPTGRGWVDRDAMQAAEYLHRGDVASVAVQYSYLPSWLSLMSESSYGLETAQAVFAEVYGHWRELPPDERPELYLHGLSLGALNSERAADLYDIVGDPFSGALWSGPPFRSEAWREITAQREPDSPAWLPRFRDSSIVRFTNQDPHLEIPGAEWGAMRIVYLQYASDPVTFFEPEAFYRQPEWMEEPRGPDVTDKLQWYPVVTMLQLAIDVAAADDAPVGYGHVYAPEHYVYAWRHVTDPEGWSEDELQRLKDHLRGDR